MFWNGELVAKYFILLNTIYVKTNQWFNSLNLLQSGSWNLQCWGLGLVHGSSLLFLLLDVAPLMSPSGSGYTGIQLCLRPSRFQMARGGLHILFYDKVRPRLLTPAAQPLTWWASAKFPRRMHDASSDSGGENIMGMNELWVGGCNSFLADTMFRLPSVGTQKVGAKEATEIEEKLHCCNLPPNSLSSKSLFFKRCVSGYWFSLNWRANLCYHVWI